MLLTTTSISYKEIPLLCSNQILLHILRFFVIEQWTRKREAKNKDAFLLVEKKKLLQHLDNSILMCWKSIKLFMF